MSSLALWPVGPLRREERANVWQRAGTAEVNACLQLLRGCGQGFCPLDRQLGLEDTSLSPTVTRMVAVGAMVSFREGSQLLQELAGVSINAEQDHSQRFRLPSASFCNLWFHKCVTLPAKSESIFLRRLSGRMSVQT